jgi:membrane fusion protein (multidrug efflux system)
MNAHMTNRRNDILPRIAAAGVMLCAAALAGCKPQAGPPPALPPADVVTLTVTTRPVTLTTELPGRTEGYLSAEIRPQVNGLLKKRLFEEGTNVKQGDILYEIDDTPFVVSLENASASRARAEATLVAVSSRAKRTRELFDAKALSPQELDDTTATLQQAEADVRAWKAAEDLARIQLGYTKITAPISGRISKSIVTEGAIVTAYQSMPLTTIHQLDPMYVNTPQSTAFALRMRRLIDEKKLSIVDGKLSQVRLILEDGTPYSEVGYLQFRDVTVDPSTATVILRMTFPNPNLVLLPGMFVRAVLETGIKDNAILIPQNAVARDPKGNPYVLLVNPENIVEVRPIQTKQAIGNEWLVSEGLAPGDRVIVEGIQKARPGSPVKVVPAKTESKPAGT